MPHRRLVADALRAHGSNAITRGNTLASVFGELGIIGHRHGMHRTRRCLLRSRHIDHRVTHPMTEGAAPAPSLHRSRQTQTARARAAPAHGWPSNEACNAVQVHEKCAFPTGNPDLACFFCGSLILLFCSGRVHKVICDFEADGERPHPWNPRE